MDTSESLGVLKGIVWVMFAQGHIDMQAFTEALRHLGLLKQAING